MRRGSLSSSPSAGGKEGAGNKQKTGREEYDRCFCQQLGFMVGLDGCVIMSLLLARRLIKAHGVMGPRGLPG